MPSKKDSDSKTNDIVFSWKKVEDWFKFDRQVLRYVRKKYGKVGEQLWLETATVIDDNSFSAIAQDTYSDLVNQLGNKTKNENKTSTDQKRSMNIGIRTNRKQQSKTKATEQ